jgi:predicted MPP superfamily phosphohydrolase
MRPLLRLVAGTAAAGTATLAYAALIERNLFTLRRFDVPVLAPGSSPLRVLHLSDLHLTPGQHRKQRWVNDLVQTDPDLVVVTGDSLASVDAVPAVLRAFQPLLERPGAFVFGSNDYNGSVLKNPFGYLQKDRPYRQGTALPTEEFRDALTGAGWLDLNNARTTLKASDRVIDLVGVDDPHIGRDDYAAVAGTAADAGTRESEPAGSETSGSETSKSEWPGRSGRVRGRRADRLTHFEPRALTPWPPTGTLLLAGHTHGGQVRMPVMARWSPTAGSTASLPGACTRGRARTPTCTFRRGSARTRPHRSGSPAHRRRRC